MGVERDGDEVDPGKLQPRPEQCEHAKLLRSRVGGRQYEVIAGASQGDVKEEPLFRQFHGPLLWFLLLPGCTKAT